MFASFVIGLCSWVSIPYTSKAAEKILFFFPRCGKFFRLNINNVVFVSNFGKPSDKMYFEKS